jgi:hypothetical protein
VEFQTTVTMWPAFTTAVCVLLLISLFLSLASSSCPASFRVTLYGSHEHIWQGSPVVTNTLHFHFSGYVLIAPSLLKDSAAGCRILVDKCFLLPLHTLWPERALPPSHHPSCRGEGIGGRGQGATGSPCSTCEIFLGPKAEHRSLYGVFLIPLPLKLAWVMLPNQGTLQPNKYSSDIVLSAIGKPWWGHKSRLYGWVHKAVGSGGVSAEHYRAAAMEGIEEVKHQMMTGRTQHTALSRKLLRTGRPTLSKEGKQCPPPALVPPRP